MDKLNLRKMAWTKPYCTYSHLKIKKIQLTVQYGNDESVEATFVNLNSERPFTTSRHWQFDSIEEAKEFLICEAEKFL
jgi:hypothetical protein